MKVLYSLILCLLSSVALAQPSFTFSASTTVGTESVVPVLTWSSNSTGCTASGTPQWTGAKTPSGTQTLPAITQDATYQLTCTWAADNIATLTWTNPTTNTDGSAYTNAQDIQIKYRSTTGPLDADTACTAPVTCVVVTPPTSTTRTITGFNTAQTVRFVVVARNTAGVSSVASNEATKTFTGVGASESRTVAITVNARPNPVSSLSVQ